MNDLQANFKTKLSETELVEIKYFCSHADYFALEQSIGFGEILHKTNITYFWLKDNHEILSYCQIYESQRFAHIWFGPVSNDRDFIIISVNEIVKYYRKRGFWFLGIQMYMKSGGDCDFIEYHLNWKHHINYIFDNENTKASLEIDLTLSMDELFRRFRKGHKSDIKRAINSGVCVEEVSASEDILAFCSVYRKMCNSRSIGGHSSEEVERIVHYLHVNNMGKLLVARDSEKTIIGGSVFAFQGVSVRYLLSASDPDKRDLPVTHLIIFRALEMAKSANFKYFDFWGYNHFVSKDDQIYNVNNFKKGFGGYFTFFAKKMNINLVPGGYNIFRLFRVMKRIRNRFI